jgi:DNA-binding transcriptional MerR regulator
MKIGELAARTDLAPSAIRYYEKVGLLASAERINGQRRYSSDALDRVLLIRVAGEMDSPCLRSSSSSTASTKTLRSPRAGEN